MSFVHLHVHSYYSFLDGACSPADLVGKAAHFNMPALALTDHNRLTGAIRFYDCAQKAGIKPIIGAEIDTVGGHHLVLLCKDITGYTSLCRLLTSMHCKHQKGKIPAADRGLLAAHSQGLIALSGCVRGEIPSLLLRGERRAAALTAGFYREVYGNDFFIELFRHPSRSGTPLCRALADLAHEQGMPCVATNNVHYLNLRDYHIHELLQSIKTLTPVQQLPGPRTVEQYFKSSAEMERLFRDFPGAAAMTLEIASRCNLQLELGRPRFPAFNLPPGETAPGVLRRLSAEGCQHKYGKLTPDIQSRLEIELDTIERLGFCSYFLVMWDVVQWARRRGIHCQARGSAVDSLVVYALDISTVDPIHYNLLFERFMHPLRHEPPDIDLDIDRRRRDEVRDYIYGKYGPDNVSCVATISTYMARGAIRDAGKALQIPEATIEEACRGIHYLSATDLLEKARTLPELRNSPVYRRPELREFFDLCAAIDGFPRHLSVHLGGLLIGEGRLSDMVPLEPSSGGDIISQYDKDDIERLGLVKMDLLALPTLTVIEDTLRNIKQKDGTEIDIDAIPFDDPASFAMLREGKTIGVFQLESPAQREMAGRLLPQNFNDIIVSISLVRPGPLKSSMDRVYLARRHGQEQVSYLHPNLKGALEETLGVILYQEQVLRVAHDLAGLSYAGADGFRRAMTHDRTPEEMEKMRLAFINSSLRNGVSPSVAGEVYEQLAAFAAYGFCKAHAAAYALLSYQTLWLKCHYPAEFFAALLSNQPMGYYPPRVLVAEARRCGIRVLPPDVNRPCDRYLVEEGAIRVSLAQVRGITAEAISSIINEREKGPFISLHDFVSRTGCNRTIIENLIRVGALDSLGSRNTMLTDLTSLLRRRHHTDPSNLPLIRDLPTAGTYLTTHPSEQFPHNTGTSTMSEASDCDRCRSLLAEREILSLDLSAHPLDFCCLDGSFTPIGSLPSLPTGASVRIAGSVIRYQMPPTRTGRRVVYIIMEDGSGIADVTVFHDVQERCGGVLFRCGWLDVRGKIQRRGPGSLSVIAGDIRALQVARSPFRYRYL